MSSSAATRAKRQQDIDKAYNIQIRAASLGAAKYGAVGLSLATIGHYTWPLFRRQTLAFKGYLVSAFTMTGLVLYADRALLSHEKQQRITETALRREARIDLARRGLVGTETEISKWKMEREARLKNDSSESEHSPR